MSTEPMNVIVTFRSGQRCQYQIQVPDHDEIDLQVWFNTHKFISAREATNTANIGDVCTDNRPTFINLENVESIKEMDW